MKRYRLDIITNNDGIKTFSENRNKLVICDIPKKNKNFLKKEIANYSYQRTGVYFLINKLKKEGEINKNEKNEIYVGESDDVVKRIMQHINTNDKNFNRIVVI